MVLELPDDRGQMVSGVAVFLGWPVLCPAGVILMNVSAHMFRRWTWQKKRQDTTPWLYVGTRLVSGGYDQLLLAGIVGLHMLVPKWG